MFGPPGHAYVYLIYGIYHCLNFVTRPEGEPQAVLVRGLEPGPGVGRCSGPGLICRALDIDRSLNGIPLVPPVLYVADDGHVPAEVFTSPRVGVDYAGEWAALPWRFASYPQKPGRKTAQASVERTQSTPPETIETRSPKADATAPASKFPSVGPDV
jgi:DNA-3-methyladenine glycosylase